MGGHGNGLSAMIAPVHNGRGRRLWGGEGWCRGLLLCLDMGIDVRVRGRVSEVRRSHVSLCVVVVVVVGHGCELRRMFF